MVKALAFIVPFTLGAVMIGCGFVATVFGRELLAGAILAGTGAVLMLVAIAVLRKGDK
jgi:hypothetical protein